MASDLDKMTLDSESVQTLAGRLFTWAQDSNRFQSQLNLYNQLSFMLYGVVNQLKQMDSLDAEQFEKAFNTYNAQSSAAVADLVVTKAAKEGREIKVSQPDPKEETGFFKNEMLSHFREVAQAQRNRKSEKS